MSFLAGALGAVATAGFVAAVLATLAGSLVPWIGSVALVAGAGAGASVAWGCRGVRAGEPPTRWDLVALSLLGLVCIRQFLWLTFERQGVVFALLPFNYGDLPLHWTYVRFLASGPSFWPENPIFAGERLHYPFGIDLVAALLVQAGVPLRGALAGIGLVGSALLGLALLLWGRAFAVVAFLFSGGLAGLLVLDGRSLSDAQSALAWKNLYLALFLPQRGFLFALPAGLLVLWSFRERLLRDRVGLPLVVEGLLWGAMPLFHAHTFLFLSIVFAVWTLASRKISASYLSVAVALAPATWSVWQVTEGLRASSIVWWKPGWLIGDQNPFLFLLLNFGLYLPLVAWAVVRSWRDGRREAMLLLAPGLALFVFLFFVMLAPWDWDNTKLMLWCYLLTLPAVGELVLGLSAPLRAIVLIGLLGSGAVAVASACQGRDAVPLFDLTETGAVCAALAGLAPDDRVATVQDFNHPVALCGHPLVAGYAGHLWSHGIDAKSVEDRLALVMEGGLGWADAARSLQAHYVFFGPREARVYPRSSHSWAASAPVAEGGWGRLYSLPR